MTDKNTKPERKKNKKGIFIRLSKYVLQQWPLFILALTLTLGANQLSLLEPGLIILPLFVIVDK